MVLNIFRIYRRYQAGNLRELDHYNIVSYLVVPFFGLLGFSEGRYPVGEAGLLNMPLPIAMLGVAPMLTVSVVALRHLLAWRSPIISMAYLTGSVFTIGMTDRITKWRYAARDEADIDSE